MKLACAVLEQTVPSFEVCFCVVNTKFQFVRLGLWDLQTQSSHLLIRFHNWRTATARGGGGGGGE